jgi:ribonuclease HI
MTAKIFTDGSSFGNPGPAGAGVVIASDQVVEISEPVGITTNNEAEYKALILALQRARQMNIQEVEVFTDAELLVNQINGIYKVKNSKLFPLYKTVVALLGKFKSFQIHHIPREKNSKADYLAKQAAGRSAILFRK